MGELIELALDFLHLANIVDNEDVIDHLAISIPHRAGVEPDRADARIVAPQLQLPLPMPAYRERMVKAFVTYVRTRPVLA